MAEMVGGFASFVNQPLEDRGPKFLQQSTFFFFHLTQFNNNNNSSDISMHLLNGKQNAKTFCMQCLF